MFIMNSKTGEMHNFLIYDNGEDWTTEFLNDTWYEWTTEWNGDLLVSDDVDFSEILEDAIDHKYFFGGIFADETIVYWDCQAMESAELDAPDKFKARIREALNVG